MYGTIRILKKGGRRMKKIISKVYRGIFCLAMFVSTVFVNVTCSHKLYQEELPEELGKLRKHD